jgi:hypothetical protein
VVYWTAMITPDTKDWTWVLEKTCPECGFDVTRFPIEDIGDMIRSNAGQWAPILREPLVGERPSEDRWSALEYACHVRDVFRLYDHRLSLMLQVEDPTFPNWDQDATAIEQRYQDEDPLEVAAEIEAAGARLAERFDGVEGAAWKRTGTRSDGAHFTIETFARYFIHDPMHHLHDVAQGFRRLSGTSS